MTITTAREALLDPTGLSDSENDSTLSPRPVSLRGLTIGLLDNTKPNAMLLLDQIAADLERDHGVAGVRRYAKDYFGTPIKQELLDEIVSDVDVVITAVGDCGSCSAATVADGILFERAGIPTVSICSDSFAMSGQAMADVQGFPGFEFVMVQHPMASLDAPHIRERADQALPEVLRILGVTETA
ncbi:UGSC family (seleno)protein [Microbacterium rhizophilus]|uniref:UGSC family (seleno)protein n=1 Tax=Microbacterium rhizophilus TaxID=3138934 RepID=UPI0031EC7E6D